MFGVFFLFCEKTVVLTEEPPLMLYHSYVSEGRRSRAVSLFICAVGIVKFRYHKLL